MADEIDATTQRLGETLVDFAKVTRHEVLLVLAQTLEDGAEDLREIAIGGPNQVERARAEGAVMAYEAVVRGLRRIATDPDA